MKLRFSIRDLLWLTLVAGIGLAWWVGHLQIGREWRLINEQQRKIHEQQAELDSRAARLQTLSARLGFDASNPDPEDGGTTPK